MYLIVKNWLLYEFDLICRPAISTENHIDIYDGSDVQPPSYLNVKDAPDHETIDDISTTTFVDGDIDASQTFFSSTTSENRFELRPKHISSDVAHNGYVNIDNSSNIVTSSSSKRRNRDFGYSLSRSKSVCDISSMKQSGVEIDSESVTSSKVGESATLNRRTNYDISSLASRGSKSSRVVRNRTILGSFPLFYKLSQSLSSLNTNTTTATSATNAADCGSFVGDISQNNLLNTKLDPR